MKDNIHFHRTISELNRKIIYNIQKKIIKIFQIFSSASEEQILLVINHIFNDMKFRIIYQPIQNTIASVIIYCIND